MRRAGEVVVSLTLAFVLLSSASVVGATGLRDVDGQPAPSGPTASGFDFGVEPVNPINAPVRSFFRFTDVAAGQNLTDRVQIINSSDKAKSFYLYGADAYTSPLGGGFALGGRVDPVRDAGAWIKLPVGQYTVPAQTIAIVPFQLAVPADATPGDHVAGVVAEEILPGQKATNAGANFLTVHRVGARVYARVSGVVRPALSVQSLVLQRGHPLVPYMSGRDDVKVIFTLANTGNVRVQLDHISIRITGLLGRTVAQSSLSRPPPNSTTPSGLPDEVLPGSKMIFSRTFKNLPPIDRLTVQVTVAGEDPISNRPVGTSRSRVYWIMPWLVLLCLAVLGTGVLAWRRRHRSRTEATYAQELGAESPPREPQPVARI